MSCWPLSGSHWSVRLHPLQPRIFPKFIWTGILPPVLARHVLRNVCIDSCDGDVPSRIVLCSWSDRCHLYGVRARLFSAQRRPARVHIMQPRSFLRRLRTHCRDGQLPNRIVLSSRCNLGCLHTLPCGHHERQHWASSLQSMQSRRLLHVHGSVCS